MNLAERKLQIQEGFEASKYDEYAEHFDLISLCYCFECKEDEGNLEVTFAVDKKWLVHYCMENLDLKLKIQKKEQWLQCWNDEMRYFFRDEYTSEDSEKILEQALFDQAIVHLNFR